MVQYHKKVRSKKTGSGGILRSSSDKSKAHFGGFFAKTKVSKAKEKRESFKGKGGNRKTAASLVSFANLTVKPGQVKKTKILDVLESPDNRHYVREDVITKGAVIQTEEGKAKVTSRPGQNGVVNATLMQ